MSHICSKIEALDNLWFEPLTAKVVKAVKVTMVDSTIIVLGADGKIYTNGVRGRIAYVLRGDEGALARVLDGCIKLKVLSAKAVEEHRKDVKSRLEKRDRIWNSNQIKAYAEKLGIDLTADQLAKLEEPK